MKLANLKLGDLITITSPNSSDVSLEAFIKESTQLIASCWPSAQIQPDQISLNKFYLTSNNLRFDDDTKIALQKLDTTKVPVTSQINIRLIETSYKLSPNEIDLVLSFLKEIYMNKTVRINNVLVLNYMGRKILFRIDDVNNSATKTKSKKVDNIELVIERFNLTMNLNDNKKDSFIDSDIKPVGLSDEFLNDENKVFFMKSHFKTDKIYSDSFKINADTKFNLLENSLEVIEIEANKAPKIYLKDVAGLDKEIAILKEFFINPFERSDLYKEIGNFIYCRKRLNISRPFFMHVLHTQAKYMHEKGWAVFKRLRHLIIISYI